MTAPVIAQLTALTISAAVLAACGGPGAPLGPPSPKDILAKPLHANLKDAHFIVTGKFAEQGVSVDLAGDGELVYKAPGAGRFKFQTTVAGQKVEPSGGVAHFGTALWPSSTRRRLRSIDFQREARRAFRLKQPMR